MKKVYEVDESKLIAMIGLIQLKVVMMILLKRKTEDYLESLLKDVIELIETKED